MSAERVHLDEPRIAETAGSEATDDSPESWLVRARRAAVDVEAKRKTLEAAIELRDQLLVRAVDAGEPIRAVAKAFLLSQARVVQIIALRG